MQLFVKNDRTITLQCEPTDTILMLKQKIFEKDHIPVDRQRLIYCGRQLDDNTQTIQERRIEQNSTIHVLVRFPRSNSIDCNTIIYDEDTTNGFVV